MNRVFPLLGVMGAFVFAAQMINFPVGAGTTGHLMGGALLAYTLGPAAASVVMAAILAIQALVFQDGGILSLGANIVNMAIFGVLAGYLPFYLARQGRKLAIFAGGFLSVSVTALLALGELLISGVRMPASVFGVSLALFAVSGILEGAITLAVVQSLERMQPGFVHKPRGGRGWALPAAGIATVLLAAVGVLVASTNPDGIEKLAEVTGIASRAQALLATPFADYQSPWLGKAGAGLAGIAMIYAACLLLGRLAARNRSV